MKYQIWGDKLTIYGENYANRISQGKRERIIERIMKAHDINWIVIDCEQVQNIDNDMLSLISTCSSSGAEVVAVNANADIKSFLFFCFVEVAEGVYYTPDSNKMILILEDIMMNDINFIKKSVTLLLKDKMQERDIDEMSGRRSAD